MTDPWQERGFVNVPTGRLAYAARGTGKPLVLLHKLGGWLADWEPLARVFPDGARLVAIDLTGHGASENTPPTTWEFPLEQGVADLVAALDGLDIPCATFFGNSIGGNIAMILATTSPDRFDNLILSSSTMRVGKTREQAEEVDEEDSSTYDANNVPVARSHEMTASYFGSPRPDLNDLMNQSRIQAGPWVRWWERGGFLYDFAGLLPKITVPTTVMFGDQDPYIEKYEAIARETIPNVRIVSIPGASRFPQQEQPEETAKVVADVLFGLKGVL